MAWQIDNTYAHKAVNTVLRQERSAGEADVPVQFALKEVLSKDTYYPLDSRYSLTRYLPLNEPALQFIHQHHNIAQVYWADVLCLDPTTREELEVTADELVTGDERSLFPSISPGDNSNKLGSSHGLWGAPPPPTRGAPWHAPSSRLAHAPAVGRAGHAERDALTLDSDRVCVSTQQAQGPVRLGDAPLGRVPPAAAGHVHHDPTRGPSAAGAKGGGYGTSAPLSTSRIMAEPDTHEALASGVANQARAVNAYNSGVDPPASLVSPPDPPDYGPDCAGGGGAHGAPAAPSAWMTLVERSCKVAAQQSRGVRNPRLAGGVQLQMRIAMELCDLGSLAGYLSKPGWRGEHLSVRVARRQCGRDVSAARCALLTALNIAEALRHMHVNSVIHGDLKPHNVLLARAPDDERGFRAKVTDFGLAAHMRAGETALHTVQGTPAYLPMQVFMDGEVTQASDIYALGLVLWEIYHGLLWAHAWFDEKQRRKPQTPSDMEFYRPACVLCCPGEYASIVHECIRCNPNTRPSAVEVCERLRSAIASLCPPVPEDPDEARPAVAPPGAAPHHYGSLAAGHDAIPNAQHDDMLASAHSDSPPLLPDTIPVIVDASTAYAWSAGPEHSTAHSSNTVGAVAGSVPPNQSASGFLRHSAYSTGHSGVEAELDERDQHGTGGEDWFHPEEEAQDLPPPPPEEEMEKYHPPDPLVAVQEGEQARHEEEKVRLEREIAHQEQKARQQEVKARLEEEGEWPEAAKAQPRVAQEQPEGEQARRGGCLRALLCGRGL
eukprot:jgi/Ulvmu1/5561/UM023_0098.1